MKSISACSSPVGGDNSTRIRNCKSCAKAPWRVPPTNDILGSGSAEVVLFVTAFDQNYASSSTTGCPRPDLGSASCCYRRPAFPALLPLIALPLHLFMPMVKAGDWFHAAFPHPHFHQGRQPVGTRVVETPPAARHSTTKRSSEQATIWIRASLYPRRKKQKLNNNFFS
jgi:hypothetical protein